MLRALVVGHPVVNVDFFELIVIRKWSSGDVHPGFSVLVGFEHQKLSGIVEMPGDLKQPTKND